MRPKIQILAAAGIGVTLGFALPHQFHGLVAMDAGRSHAFADAALMKAMVTAPAAAPTAHALPAPPADEPAAQAPAQPAAEHTETRAEYALRVLRSRVRKQSHPDALRYALEAYFNYRSVHPDKVRKPYLYFVDYGLDSSTPRGWVFDMDALKVVDGPFTVAHGRGSGGNGVPTRFGNNNGSATSSLGLFLAQETYAFRGHTNGRLYRSIGLRLNGLSGVFNSAARSRGVVVHGAPYVTSAKAGRSEGCPAMEPGRASRLIPKIGNGGMVFLFSPRDPRWMNRDPWTHADDES